MKLLRKIFPRKKEEKVEVIVNGMPIALAIEEDLSDFKKIAHRIFPRIKVKYDFDIYTGDKGAHMGKQQMTIPEADAPIFMPLFDDVLLGFALDIGNAYQILSNRFLIEHLEINVQQLKTLAIENMLREIGDKIQVKGSKESIVMITIGGNFEAATILLETLWEDLQSFFNDDVCRDDLRLAGHWFGGVKGGSYGYYYAHPLQSINYYQ